MQSTRIPEYQRNLELAGAIEVEPIVLETDYLRTGGKVYETRAVQAG